MKTSDVAVVILFDQDRMLISLRPQQTYFGGWWEWPGGKRIGEESVEACARRELMEEIGLEAGELLTFGFFEEVLSKLVNEPLHDALRDLIKTKFRK